MSETGTILKTLSYQVDFLWGVMLATAANKKKIPELYTSTPTIWSQAERIAAEETMVMLMPIASGIDAAGPEELKIICDILLRYKKFLSPGKWKSVPGKGIVDKFYKEAQFDLFAEWNTAVSGWIDRNTRH